MSNIIQEKSFEFSLKILKFGNYFGRSKGLDIVLNQVIRSGTSIGANIEEALGCETKKDFLSKISIAYKEARETKYWLLLILEAYKLKVESLLRDCEELLKVLGKIKTSTRKNINKK